MRNWGLKPRKPQLVCGIDLAKPGSDKSVACVWIDGRLLKTYEGPHAGEMAQAFVDGYERARDRSWPG